MSADLIEDAINCLRGEGWDNDADAVAGLAAEIELLRADNEFLHKFVDAPGSILEAALNEVKQLLAAIAEQQAAFGDAIETASKTLVTKDSAIARLRKIAIKHLAWAKFIETELDAIPQEKNYEDYREKYERDAAKELDLRVTQEAGYVEKLEEAFLEATRQIVYANFGMDGIHRPEGEDAYAEKVAKAALSKIREGKP